MCNVGGRLGDDVCEGVLSRVEGVEPEFAIAGAKDNLLPPLSAGKVCPDPVLNNVEVVPKYSDVYGIQDALIIVVQQKVMDAQWAGVQRQDRWFGA